MAFDLSKITSVFKRVSGMGNAVVGVDIGSSSIKIVQLHMENDTATLDTYGELQLGPYAGTDIGRTAAIPTRKLTEALVDIMRESGVASKNVALALSFNSSFMTVLSLPRKEATDIEAMIPVEARKHIPVSLNEVTLDWFPVSSDTSDEETVDIMLVAIHNEALQKLQSAITGAGLNQQTIELELFSAIRSSAVTKEGTFAIVDIGAGSTKLYFVQNGTVTKTHSLRMNGVELTDAVASALGVTFEIAEATKRKTGLLGTADDTKVQRALTSVLERGFKEILTFIKRQSEEENIHLDRVELSGSGALLHGIDAYAKDMLGCEITLADPFSHVSHPTFLKDTLKEAGPTFLVAVGVAQSGLMHEK